MRQVSIVVVVGVILLSAVLILPFFNHLSDSNIQKTQLPRPRHGPPPYANTIILHAAAYQPVQVCWLVDPGHQPYYPQVDDWVSDPPDAAGDLTAHSNISMVVNKNTHIFGCRPIENIVFENFEHRKYLNFSFANYYLVPKTVRVDFRLVGPGVNTVVQSTPSVPLPAGVDTDPTTIGVETPGMGDISLTAPIPGAAPFRFPTPGNYQLIAQLVDTSTNAVEDKQTLNVNAVATQDIGILLKAVVFREDLQNNIVVAGTPIQNWINLAGGRLDNEFYTGEAPRFFNAIYPVRENGARFFYSTPIILDNVVVGGKVVRNLSGATALSNNEKNILQWNILATHSDLAVVSPDWNRIVLLVPHGILRAGVSGVSAPATNKRVVFVNWSVLEPWAGVEGPGKTVAHEIGHTFGLADEYNNAGVNFWNAYGFRVNRNEYRDPKPSVMGRSGMSPDGKYWMTKPKYLHLLNRFSQPVLDPTVLLIAGVLYKNDTFVPAPVWNIYQGDPDLQAGVSGTHKVRFVGFGGATLGEYNFTANFSVNLDDIGVVSGDAVPIFLSVLVPVGAGRVQLLNGTTGAIIYERILSPNPPTVTVLYPNGGENETPPMVIKWTASDPDGDPLTYSVFLSNDSGVSWDRIAYRLTTQSYNLTDTFGLPSGNYLVKVVASDGVNSGEDVSDGTFTFYTSQYFAVAVTPPTQTVNAYLSENCTYTLNISSVGGFSDTVSVTVVQSGGLTITFPNGTSATLTPNGYAILTVKVFTTQTTPSGNYTIQLAVSNATVTKIVSFNVEVVFVVVPEYPAISPIILMAFAALCFALMQCRRHRRHDRR